MGYAGAGALQTLGRGIRDIGSLAGGLRRERDEDERLKTERERELARQKMLDDIALSEKGGGRGAAPTVTETIPTRGAPRRPDLRTGPLYPEPGAGGMGVKAPESYMPTPARREAAPLTVETTDTDRYRTGGEGDDSYYFERPDYRRTRLAGEEADRASEDRAAAMGRMAPAIGRIAGGEGTGMDMAALEVEGIDPTRYAPEKTETGFDPNTDPALRRLRERAANPERYGDDASDGGVDRGSAAWMRMRGFVDDDEQFFALPAEEKNQITDDMMAGTYETPRGVAEASSEGESTPWYKRVWNSGMEGIGRGLGARANERPATSGEVVTPRNWGIGGRVGGSGDAPPPAGTQRRGEVIADQSVLDEGAEHYRLSGSRAAATAAMRQDEWDQDEIDYMLEILDL